jgi:hypothetical protein
MSNGATRYKRGDRSPLTQAAVLVVEGRDMWEFFGALLYELGLHGRVDVRDPGGITDWPDFLRALPAISGFDAVNSLGLVRDCETDPARALQDVCTALRGASLPVPPAVLQPTATPPPPRVTIMLLPEGNTPGMLETLCWRALAGDPRIPCIEEFLDCVERAVGQPVARAEKSRIHAYIAAREEPWFLLGQAARSRYFPWDSPAFAEAKQFLQDLIASTP